MSTQRTNDRAGFQTAGFRPVAGRRGPGGPFGPPGMGMPGDKAKNFKRSLSRLVGYLRPYRVTLAVVFIFAIASTVFTIYAPQETRKAMNHIQDVFVARSVIGKASELQIDIGETAGERLKAERESPRNNDPVSDPASVAALREFIALPRIDDIDDPSLKAETVGKIFTLATLLAGTAGADTAGTDGFTPERLRDALRAVSETGGRVDASFLLKIVLTLVVLYLVSAGFGLAMGIVMSDVSQKTVLSLRREVDAKLSKLPLSYYDLHPHGDILSRLTNDVDTIAHTLQQGLTQIITSIVSILGYIVMMLVVSPFLTALVLLSLPLYVFSTMAVTKRSQKYFVSQQKELGALSGHVEETYTGHTIVKAFGREKASVAKFEDMNAKLYDSAWRAQFVSGIMHPLMNFIGNLSYVVICVLGGLWITKGLLRIGDIVIFIQYSRSFTQPIIQTANIANVIQSTVACAERVFETLDEPEEKPDPENAVRLEAPRGDVSIRAADFRYKPEVPLIEDLNLEVSRGRTVAIVGPTGAGKTTLVNLLMRFYELNAGSIRIDGVDVTEMKRGDLRRLFGMVLQDAWLFNGTIRDNIAYGRPDASTDEIVRAAQAAHADHFIRTLPDGYATVLNEEATNISLGQKQLLTIARAVLADPVILILDEATSSVDTRTEVLIRRAMSALMKDRTSFVIAHRLSTVRDAELILVMDQGKIVERGTHPELLAKNGFYADLYNSQFAGRLAGSDGR